MINYILQVVLFQALFLAVYDFFLQKETFFKWNRVYLLATPFISFIIPLLKIDKFQQAVPQDYMVQLPTVFLNPEAFIIGANTNEASFNYLAIIFYLGIIVFSSLFLIRLYKIIKLITSNEVIKEHIYSLVLLKTKQSAFSFFNFIFINKEQLENKALEVVQHELVHCRQKHSIDLLIFEMLKIVFWFNPLIYVFQKRITLLHEYISDAEVVKETDEKTYFNRLLAETFNVDNISFINQFYKQSLIKKRIVMITKEKSQKMKQLKYLLLIPLIVCMLILSSFDSNYKESLNETLLDLEFNGLKGDYFSTIKNVSVTNEKIKKQVFQTKDTINEVSFAIIEEVPVFPGCEGTESELRKCFKDQIFNHVSTNFNTTLANSLGLEAGVKRVFVMFKIDKEGNINKLQVRAPHKSLVAEAKRVIRTLPKMIPGKHKGNPVGVKYSLPIAFDVAGDNTKQHVINNERKIEKGEDVSFANIDEVPVFPGCEGTQMELRKCLQENITKHVNINFNGALSKNLGLSPGVKRVFVMFKIDKEGNITDAKSRAPHEVLAEEALRVVKLLPKMIPGTYEGNKVGVKYSLPIAFKVE